MNPIEHLWDELGRRMEKHTISGKDQLKQLLLQEWQNIGAETTQKLVYSMPKRLSEVLKRNGWATKY